MTRTDQSTMSAVSRASEPSLGDGNDTSDLYAAIDLTPKSPYYSEPPREAVDTYSLANG